MLGGCIVLQSFRKGLLYYPIGRRAQEMYMRVSQTIVK